MDYKLHSLDKSALDTALSLHDAIMQRKRQKDMEKGETVTKRNGEQKVGKKEDIPLKIASSLPTCPHFE